MAHTTEQKEPEAVRLNFTVPAEFQDMLSRLAKANTGSMTAEFRRLVRAAYEAQFGTGNAEIIGKPKMQIR